jgi:hypothetical protein
MTIGSSSFDWQFYLKWVIASTLGWLIGLAFGRPEIGIGVIVGIVQWIILRPMIHQASWWILASGLGWAVGWAAIILIFPEEIGVIAGGFIGFTVGISQWVIMRRWFYQAGWWIIISTLAWAIGLTGIMGETFVGTVVGAITGISLELMFRIPLRPEQV